MRLRFHPGSCEAPGRWRHAFQLLRSDATEVALGSATACCAPHGRWRQGLCLLEMAGTRHGPWVLTFSSLDVDDMVF